MRWVRLVLRIFGWLLTPFMAWAASFFGAVGGSLLARGIEDPGAGLVVTAAVGAVSGFVALYLWLRLLRTSPEIREALAVTEDGTPDTATLGAIVTEGATPAAPADAPPPPSSPPAP